MHICIIIDIKTKQLVDSFAGKMAHKKSSLKNDKAASKRPKVSASGSDGASPATNSSSTITAQKFIDMSRIGPAARIGPIATATASISHAPISISHSAASLSAVAANFSHITKALANAGFAQARMNFASSVAAAGNLSASFPQSHFSQSQPTLPRLDYAQLMAAAVAAAQANAAAAQANAAVERNVGNTSNPTL